MGFLGTLKNIAGIAGTALFIAEAADAGGGDVATPRDALHRPRGRDPDQG